VFFLEGQKKPVLFVVFTLVSGFCFVSARTLSPQPIPRYPGVAFSVLTGPRHHLIFLFPFFSGLPLPLTTQSNLPVKVRCSIPRGKGIQVDQCAPVSFYLLLLPPARWQLLFFASPLKWLLAFGFWTAALVRCLARACRLTSRTKTAMSERGAFALAGCRSGDIGCSPSYGPDIMATLRGPGTTAPTRRSGTAGAIDGAQTLVVV
jgi:hypothetical protein